MSDELQEQDAPMATEQGAEEAPSRWPQPVPEEWKQSRAAKAEEWFQQRKEELHSQYHGAKQAVVDAAARKAAAAQEKAAFDGRVQAMVREQQAYSRAVQQQLSVLRQQRLDANLEYEALRLPHLTPPRPLALLTAPEGGPSFVERLFNRALATTLMTAVAAEAEGDKGRGGGGGGGGGEAVWCEMGQNRVSMQDPPLARAEALERCRMALAVLSPALLASPQWALERRILTARLTAPPGTWPGAPLAAVLIVRLHVPPPASVGEAAAAAVAGMGRKAAATAAAATAAAAAPDPNPPPPLVLPDPVPGYPVQSYPVTVIDMTVPLPADPPAEGAAAGTALAQEVRSAVATVLEIAARGGGLAAAGLRLLPDPPPVHLHPAHVHEQPEQLLAASLGMTGGSGGGGDAAAASALAMFSSLTLSATLAAAGGSSSSLATQILASPAHAAVAPGAAATAAHMLPPAHSLRAVEDWTMYDTTMFLSCLGRSLGRWVGGFLALAVDGPLLVVADDSDLRAACGVAADKAVAVIRQALESAKRRPGLLAPSRALLPLPDCPASPLPPEAAVMPPPQRAALLADIFTYYDQDHSGDLNMEELDRLVTACGLRLDPVRLKEVLDDYDDDSDGRLNAPEAVRLLLDVWRLVMAQQDVAAWTPSESAAALRDAIDLEWSLETPRATPDADKTAARTAAARAAFAGRPGSAAGSDAPSINIVGSTPGSGATTPPRSVAGAVARAMHAAPSASASAVARSVSGRSRAAVSPRLVEGEDETGARVRLVEHTASMSAGGGGGSDSDGTSVASYTWGLPPRLPLGLSLSMKVAASKGISEAGGSTVDSAAAPWPGAVTPRVRGKGLLSPEEMAARDVDVQQLLRMERNEAELKESLSRLLDGLDLKRMGRVELQMLRAALASSGPLNQFTPLHTQLLSDTADALSQLPTEITTATGRAGAGVGTGSRGLLASGALGEGLLGLEVPVQPYISSAVPAVVSAQEALLQVVYGERGLSAMLRQLYRQTTGPDDPLELLTRGPRVRPEASEAALESLLEVQGIKPTALLRAALLPAHQLPPKERLQGQEDDEAAAAAARGGVTPLSLHSARRYPQSWASATAHVVHVYNVLTQRTGGGGGGGGAAA